MKKKITTLALAAAMLLAAAQPALAANGGPPDTECQPGANNHRVQGWQEMSVDEFAQFLVDEFNAPADESGEPIGTVRDFAAAVYEFCDHNNDGYACVMEQHRPNAASGSNHWWLAQDNHPFGGS